MINFKKQYIFNILCVVLLFLVGHTAYAQTPVCATPGADGVQANPSPQNTFFPGAGDNITVNAGATSMVLEGIPQPFVVGGVLYNFGNAQISKGDLLMVIQIQGATINSANSDLYGSGVAANNGSGYSDLLNVGRYEYVVATNTVNGAGGELRFRGSGANGGLMYQYQNSPATSSQGVRRFQVIRIMQYSDLTLQSNVVTTPWNGKSGGVIAIDVAGTLDFNGKTINASMTGFRGGYLPARSGISDTSFSVYTSTVYIPVGSSRGSTKGEGIVGTPRYIWDGYAYVDQGSSWIGYPGGDLSRGAPGNAGGGGNVHNAGGGGGGNGGTGGAGGYGWSRNNKRNTAESILTGGRPGIALPNSIGSGRLFMGGGGGSGDANNSPNGARGGVGGGIVIITANKVMGNGVVFANGGRGEAGSLGDAGDGAGGGGAGGSIFINVREQSTGNLTLQAFGGNGGHSTTANLHGPGGGGGGGVIYYNANGVTVTTNVSPGQAGRINGGNPIDAPTYADFPIGINKAQNGADIGKVGVTKSFIPSELPPHLAQTGTCYPELTIRKWRDQPFEPVPAGATVTYHIQITNTGGGAKGVRVNDVLPTGFRFISATIDYELTSGNPQNLQNIGTDSNPVLGTFDLLSGEGATIDMRVEVPFETPEGVYHNGVQVGYLDPTRKINEPNRVIYPPTNALPGQNTTYADGTAPIAGSNYSPEQEGEEVVVARPALGVIKTIDNPCVDPTNGNTYSIVLLNSDPVTLPNVSITDVIHPDLEVVSVTGSGWTWTNSGNTYTLTLSSLGTGEEGTPFTSAPVQIRVRPRPSATASNWSNTATLVADPNVSSSTMLYQRPTTPTAEIVEFPGNDCYSGVYYISGNQPTVGVGRWEFIGESGGAYFENPNQYDTRILGVAAGQSVQAVWTISNGPCTTLQSAPLNFTRSIPATATITGGGTICGGAPITDEQAVTITFTGTGPWRVVMLNGAGLEVAMVSTSPTYTMIPSAPGTITLLEVKGGGSGGVDDPSWSALCPGEVDGIAQVNVVTEAPAGGVISYHGGPVCVGEVVPMSLVLTGQSGRVMGWQSSTNGTTWSAIIPDTEDLTSYSPIVNQNIYYRAIIRGGDVGNTPCYPDQPSATVYLTTKNCNDLSVTKEMDNPTPDAGTQVAFTIRANNLKQQQATGVTVYDRLPNGYTYVSHNASVGTYDQATGLWSMGNLASGVSQTLTITATVNQAGQYTNTATISCNEQETDYTNNSASITPDVNCDVRNVSPQVTKP